MTRLENLEQDVQKLKPNELAAFRDWFLAYDWQLWDGKLERDVQDGKLDELARKALEDHAKGRTTRI